MFQDQNLKNIDILNAQADKLRDQGIYCQAVLIYKRLLLLYKKTKNTEGIGHCLFQIGLCYRLADQHKFALEAFQKAAKFSQDNKMSDRLANIYREIGNVYYYQDKFNLAKKWQEKSIKILKNSQDLADYGMSLLRYAVTLTHYKKFSEAEKLMKKSLTLIIKSNDWFFIVLNNYFLGKLYFFKKEYQKAIDCLEEAEEILNEHQQSEIHRRTYALIWAMLAYCQLKLNNLEMAKNYYFMALKFVFSMPNEMASSLYKNSQMIQFLSELKKQKSEFFY